MNTEERPSLEDRLIDLLAAYDDALAQGGSSPVLPDSEAPPRLQRDLAYLQILRQVLKPGQVGQDTPHSGATPRVPKQEPVNAVEGAAATTLGEDTATTEEPADFNLTSLGRFQIRGELGRGGFGVVFLAYDPSLQREVALKVPRAEGLITPEFRERFEREGRASASLDHPHIVPVHEVGEVGPLCYIVSAYCPGTSLLEWIKRQSAPVPVKDAATLIQRLAEAVHHAHSRGVVHRDLKPGNVLLQNADCNLQNDQGSSLPQSAFGNLQSAIPKITDFGLAKLLQEEKAGAETRSGAIMGTPQYMAPEQAAGKNRAVGPAADIYALGVILYELLTGRTPFQGETPLDTLLQVQSAEPLPPTRLRPRLSRDLETICLHCLHKDPRKRYGSAQELADDLRRFLNGEAIQARPVGRIERTWKWARRKPAQAGLLAAIAGAALALVGLLLVHLNNLEERAQFVTDLKDADEKLDYARRDLKDIQGRSTKLVEDSGILKGELKTLDSALGALRTTRTEEEKRFELDRLKFATTRDFDRRDVYALTLARARDLFEATPLAGLALLEDRDRCPPDLRDFGWGLLHRLCNRRRLTLDDDKAAIHTLAVSPDGQTLASGSGVPDKFGEAKLWDLPTGRLRATLVGHSGPVSQIAFSPDGKSLTTLSETAISRDMQFGEVKLWDAATAKHMWTLESKGGCPSSVRYMADSKSLIVLRYVENAGYEAIWFETETGKRLATRPLGVVDFIAGAVHLAFSGDGKLLASARRSGGAVVHRFPDLGKPVNTLLPHDAVSVAFAPTGTLLAVAGKHVVKVHDLKTGDEVASMPKPAKDIHDIYRVAWSPDGKFLLVVGGFGSIIWEPRALRQDFPLMRYTVTFSPDGRFLVGDDSEGMHVWDVAAVRRREFLPGVEGYLAVSSDGKTLAVAPRKPALNKSSVGAIQLWNIGVSLEPDVLPGPTQAVGITRGGKTTELLPTAPFPSGHTQVWDAFSGKLEGKVPGAYGMNLSPDGKTIVVIAKDFIRLHVWDVATAKERAVLDHKTRIDTSNRHVDGLPTPGLVFSPDSKTLATMTMNGELRLWDLDSGAERTMISAKYGFLVPRFSSDGKMLACAIAQSPPSIGPKIKPNPKTVRDPPKSGPAEAPPAPEIVLLEVATGKRLDSLTELKGQVTGVVFSPDGKLLASITPYETLLWDLETRKVRQTFRNLGGLVFSPDGATLVFTDTLGTTTKICDLASGKVRASFPTDGGIQFSPDGKTMMTGFKSAIPSLGKKGFNCPPRLTTDPWCFLKIAAASRSSVR